MLPLDAVASPGHAEPRRPSRDAVSVACVDAAVHIDELHRIDAVVGGRVWKTGALVCRSGGRRAVAVACGRDEMALIEVLSVH